jgi:signal transduction histidine kinase
LEFALPYSLEKQRLIADVNIGNAFLENERMDSAYVYYLKAYNNPLIDRRREIKAAVLINLGLYYNRIGQYYKSLEFLKNGLEVAKEVQLLEFQMNAYKELSKLKKQQSLFQEALEYYELYFNLSDSLKNIEANHQLALVDYEKLMIKEKYNNDLLVQENKAQQEQIGTQRIVLFLVILVVLSLSILLFVFWRNKRITKSLNKQLKESNNQLESTNLNLISQKEEMKALLMSKDRFVSMLGHDLKNPFSGLLGLLELMLDDWDSLPDSEKKSGIHQLSISARQTFEFLQSLLDWGKAQQGLIRPQPEKIKLKDIAEELSAVFFAQYSKKNIKVKTEIPDNFEVFSDRKLISHILQNFFTNAIKYSFEGDFITLKSREESGKIFICIQDQGIGIPKDKLEDLFNLDSNFNRLGTAGEASTGMGLILCKEYAQLIGGEIKVESQVDIGSEFCLIIDNKKNL